MKNNTRPCGAPSNVFSQLALFIIGLSNRCSHCRKCYPRHYSSVGDSKRIGEFRDGRSQADFGFPQNLVKLA